MATTLVTPVPKITTAGLTIPTYMDYYQFLVATMQSIYGEDIYIDNDSQDGQFIQILALAMADSAKVLQSLYQSFSPTYASGAGLSRLVKINNIRRKGASFSTCDVTLTGQALTTIRDGTVRDVYNNVWDLPPEVIIPASGQITVTATAQKIGSIYLSAGQLSTIGTPTRGWQSVTNASASNPGKQIETDSALRKRRDTSTGISATTPIDSITARIADIDGVVSSAVYENSTDSTDANGIPEHSISVVCYGGDSQEIADTIFASKTIGANTYGTTTIPVTDSKGIVSNISFFRPTVIYPYVRIVIHPIKASVDQTIIDNIVSSINAYMNNLTIGFSLNANRLYSIAYSQDADIYDPSFNINSIQLSLDNSVWSDSVIAAFNQIILGKSDQITVTIA